MKAWSFLAALVLLVVPSSATIVNSVSCYAYPNKSLGTDSCLQEGFYPVPGSAVYGYQRAQATASAVYAVSGANFTWRQSAVASASNVGTAEANSLLSLAFSTPGPSRLGVVKGVAYPNTMGAAEAGFRFDSNALNLPGSSLTAPPTYVALGGLFTFEAYANVTKVDGIAGGGSQGDVNVFELDGVTPVSITEVSVPEPSTLTLVGSLIAVEIFRRRPKTA